MSARKNFRLLLWGGMAIAMYISFFPDTAHAGYLDPGPGSTLAQVIIAAAAGIRRFWAGLLSPFTRFFKK